MNNVVATKLLLRELERFRAETYAELVSRIGLDRIGIDVVDDGVEYQIKIHFFWDDRPGGDIRVMGAIDDGGWRAFMPLTQSFIKSPDGSFVGE